MPRGGARSGAGRKPKKQQQPIAPAPESNVVVFEGGRAGEVSKTPPADLPEDQQGFWRVYAPLALERRTLTAQTAGAMRQLCELEALKATVKQRLDTDGLTSGKVTTDVTSGEQHLEIKPHPLLRTYTGLVKEIKALQKDFMLCPFGKPVSGAPKSTSEQRKATVRQQFFGGAPRG